MTKSLRTRIEALREAVERATTPERVVVVEFVVVRNRGEAAALDRLLGSEPPASTAPRSSGRIRLVPQPAISAAEYLQQHGVALDEPAPASIHGGIEQ